MAHRRFCLDHLLGHVAVHLLHQLCQWFALGLQLVSSSSEDVTIMKDANAMNVQLDDVAFALGFEQNRGCATWHEHQRAERTSS